MSLNFPASPTNGQVYDNWIYSSAKGAWEAKPLDSAKTITADVAPANPDDGDQWFNTNDGTLYIYVVDLDGGQWVESQAPITANGYYSPNYIINGGFDIWQRGTSQTSSGYGSADRWSNVCSGTTTISQETSDLPSVAGIRFGIKFVTGASSSFGQFYTALEQADVIRLRGKTLTLSAYVKISGSYAGNWQMKVYSSNSVDTPLSSVSSLIGTAQNIATAATSSWTRVSYTFTMPSDAVGFKIEFSPDTVQPSGVTVRMTGVQLEEGAVATTFRRNANSLQGELAACQRYYYRLNVSSVGTSGNPRLAPGYVLNSSSSEYAIRFAVPMRIVPTSFDSSAANTFASYNASSGVLRGSSITSAPSDSSNETGHLQLTITGGSMTQSQAVVLLNFGGTSCFLGWTAEL
jgi:hypothetical protein